MLWCWDRQQRREVKCREKKIIKKMLLLSVCLSVLPLLLLLCSITAHLQLYLWEKLRVNLFFTKDTTLSDTGVLHTTMFFASCHTPFLIFNVSFSLIFLIAHVNYPSVFVHSSFLMERKRKEKNWFWIFFCFFLALMSLSTFARSGSRDNN